MAEHNMLFSEACSVLDAIDADAYTAATYTTGWIDMSIWSKIGALVAVGDLGSSATVAAKLEQSGPTSGTGTKDITGKAIVGLTQTPTNNSNTQQWINCRNDELDAINNFRYVRLSITIGTATSDAAGYVFGLDCKYGPATDHDNANVTQVIN